MSASPGHLHRRRQPPPAAAAAPPPQLSTPTCSCTSRRRNGGTANPGPQLGQITFQFNPKELTLTKTAKWKRDAQRNAKKSGAARVHRLRPVQADAGDVLRRHRHAWTARW